MSKYVVVYKMPDGSEHSWFGGAYNRVQAINIIRINTGVKIKTIAIVEVGKEVK